MTSESHRDGTCERVSGMLSDYHDGRFAPGSAEADEVESHIAVCPACAEMLDDFRAITAAARLLRQVAGVERSGAVDARQADRALGEAGSSGPAPSGAALAVVDLREESARVQAAVARSLRKLVFLRRLAWTGTALSAAAAAAALVAALVLPPAGRPETRPPALAETQESPAGELAPSGPDGEGSRTASASEASAIFRDSDAFFDTGIDIVEASVRAELERTLQEAGLFNGTKPSEWVAIHEEAELARPRFESLFRPSRSRRSGPRPGVVTVSSDGR